MRISLTQHFFLLINMFLMPCYPTRMEWWRLKHAIAKKNHGTYSRDKPIYMWISTRHFLLSSLRKSVVPHKKACSSATAPAFLLQRTPRHCSSIRQYNNIHRWYPLFFRVCHAQQHSKTTTTSKTRVHVHVLWPNNARKQCGCLGQSCGLDGPTKAESSRTAFFFCSTKTTIGPLKRRRRIRIIMIMTIRDVVETWTYLLSAAIAASGDSKSGLTSEVLGAVARGVDNLSVDATSVGGQLLSRGVVEGFKSGLQLSFGARGVPAGDNACRGVDFCSAQMHHYYADHSKSSRASPLMRSHQCPLVCLVFHDSMSRPFQALGVATSVLECESLWVSFGIISRKIKKELIRVIFGITNTDGVFLVFTNCYGLFFSFSLIIIIHKRVN